MYFGAFNYNISIIILYNGILAGGKVYAPTSVKENTRY